MWPYRFSSLSITLPWREESSHLFHVPIKHVPCTDCILCHWHCCGYFSTITYSHMHITCTIYFIITFRHLQKEWMVTLLKSLLHNSIKRFSEISKMRTTNHILPCWPISRSISDSDYLSLLASNSQTNNKYTTGESSSVAVSYLALANVSITSTDTTSVSHNHAKILLL